ncbi:MAG: hypothetical protein DRH04_08935, partial [Deltaproteobacteria bacterium]
VLWGRNLKKGDDPRRVLSRLQKMMDDQDAEMQGQFAGKQNKLLDLRTWLGERPVMGEGVL